MTDRELMQQALDALDSDNPDIQLRTATHLRAALAQPEPEPVAWMVITMGEVTSMQPYKIAAAMLDGTHQLYTAPPQREWQGLTDEELLDIADMAYANDLELLQTLQAKLKEKNHG